jgi:hypothetical protein
MQYIIKIAEPNCSSPLYVKKQARIFYVPELTQEIKEAQKFNLEEALYWHNIFKFKTKILKLKRREKENEAD